jgi:arginine exporter protein ArgO
LFKLFGGKIYLGLELLSEEVVKLASRMQVFGAVLLIFGVALILNSIISTEEETETVDGNLTGSPPPPGMEPEDGGTLRISFLGVEIFTDDPYLKWVITIAGIAFIFRGKKD